MLPTCRFGRYRPCRVGWACGSARKESPCCVCRPAVTPFDPSSARSPGLPAWRWRFVPALPQGLPAGRPAWRSGTPSWPPLAELSQFDWVVLEAAHLKPADVGYLKEQGSTPFAYLSVGEWRRRRHRRQRPGPGQERGPQPSLEQPGNGPRRAELAGVPAQARRGAAQTGLRRPVPRYPGQLPATGRGAPRGPAPGAGQFPRPAASPGAGPQAVFQSRFRSAAGVARRRVGGGRGVDPCRLGRRCRAIPRGAPGRSRLAEGPPGCPARPGNAHRRHRLPAAGAA